MKENEKNISVNKKAHFNYEIVSTYEAGLVLLGSEVKSLRQGKANLNDSYGHINKGEIYLRNCHISPYDHAGYTNHEPLREKKLLLHRREIKRLIGKVNERGFTLVPLKLYFKDGRAKVLLGLARGKKSHDKSKEIKERDLKRDMERDFKSHNVR
ncbi:SsrA-binding protein SmpB [bacterium]|nr:SsrA-binding protein SmpB [bacterium]